jgi:hypothetical protein
MHRTGCTELVLRVQYSVGHGNMFERRHVRHNCNAIRNILLKQLEIPVVLSAATWLHYLRAGQYFNRDGQTGWKYGPGSLGHNI